jgi:ELWxxDGT repeat protein
MYELTLANEIICFMWSLDSSQELWRSDGTDAGTTRVKETAQLSRPQGLTELNGRLYFAAYSEPLDQNVLWRSDGTDEGTTWVRSAVSGAPVAGPVRFATFVDYNRLVAIDDTLFIAWDGLWKSDGTDEGTVVVRDDIGVGFPTNGDGRLFFVHGGSTPGKPHELWTSDGTPEGTVRLKAFAALHSGVGVASWHRAACHGGLYFSADDGEHGRELWFSDGTEAGTRLVRDIGEYWVGSDPVHLTRVGDKLYFSAYEAAHGYELWVVVDRLTHNRLTGAAIRAY